MCIMYEMMKVYYFENCVGKDGVDLNNVNGMLVKADSQEEAEKILQTICNHKLFCYTVSEYKIKKD